MFFQDVLELLEKRVKSRFSHRQLHLLPTWKFDDYLEIFQLYLKLPPDFPDKQYVKHWNQKVEVCAGKKIKWKICGAVAEIAAG